MIVAIAKAPSVEHRTTADGLLTMVDIPLLCYLPFRIVECNPVASSMPVRVIPPQYRAGILLTPILSELIFKL
jgi:hypothetical protein